MTFQSKKIYNVDNVTKIYGDRYILSDISFDVKEGEIFGIIGSSGSGKTTLLNLLIGFISPEKGEIKYNLLNKESQLDLINKKQNHLKEICGFAAQNPSFYPNLKVIENLLYFGSLYSLKKQYVKERAEELLRLVGLEQSKHMLSGRLSGGMQRRLDIACSLIHNPKILLLDEPTADLDKVMSSNIWNLLRVINRQGTTIVIASHHITDLEDLCTRVAILRDGTFVTVGNPETIKSKNKIAGKIQIKSMPGNYDKISKNIKRIKGVNKINVDESGITIFTKEPGKIVKEAVNVLEEKGEKVVNIEFVKPRLEEVFVKINSDKLVGKKVSEKENKVKKARKRRIKKKRSRQRTPKKVEEKKIEKVVPINVQESPKEDVLEEIKKEVKKEKDEDL